jgi:TorA maturation chaperone TorD
MSVAAAPLRVHRALPPEEAARGDFYALLARLLHRGADAGLLDAIASAEPIPAGGDETLSAAWDALSRASSVMDADAAGEEYDRLFVGVGQSPLSIYAGYYLGAAAIDHPRVRLQADLAGFGLERRGEGEPEDHFATLLDVMRVLVSGGAGREPASVAEQKRFFDGYLKDGASRFFKDVIACEGANYYRRVAALGLAFMAIETESFDLE